jgi:hypothetical protein
MRALTRFVLVLCLFGLVVVPLSAGTRGQGDRENHEIRGIRELRLPAKARIGGLQKSMTCYIYCSNGDYAEKGVETRGGCLDACESFCGEQCVLF